MAANGKTFSKKKVRVQKSTKSKSLANYGSVLYQDSGSMEVGESRFKSNHNEVPKDAQLTMVTPYMQITDSYD